MRINEYAATLALINSRTGRNAQQERLDSGLQQYARTCSGGAAALGAWSTCGVYQKLMWVAASMLCWADPLHPSIHLHVWSSPFHPIDALMYGYNTMMRKKGKITRMCVCRIHISPLCVSQRYPALYPLSSHAHFPPAKVFTQCTNMISIRPGRQPSGP